MSELTDYNKEKINSVDNPLVHNIRIAETLYSEIENYRTTVLANIDKKFKKKYSIRWWIPIISILISLILYAIIALSSPVFFAPFLLITLMIIFLIFVLTILHSGYTEIKCKITIKKQTQFFMYKMDSILKPLGIVNEKYNRYMFSDPKTDYEMEIATLTKARDSIMEIDLSEIYATPYIRFSFTDFLKGKNPTKEKKD